MRCARVTTMTPHSGRRLGTVLLMRRTRNVSLAACVAAGMLMAAAQPALAVKWTVNVSTSNSGPTCAQTPALCQDSSVWETQYANFESRSSGYWFMGGVFRVARVSPTSSNWLVYTRTTAGSLAPGRQLASMRHVSTGRWDIYSSPARKSGTVEWVKSKAQWNVYRYVNTPKMGTLKAWVAFGGGPHGFDVAAVSVAVMGASLSGQ